MSRPHLIVGLGGTGQIVLTHLKKNLFDAYNNSIPDHIRLLAFDLADESRRIETNISPVPEQDNLPEIKLGPGELNFIGGGLRYMAQDIASGRYPELDWFFANEFLQVLPPSIWDGQQGSGSIRQLGRLALYNDVLKNVNSIVLRSVRSALDELRRNRRDDQPLIVSVVSSMYGGTGSGLLVNIAQLIRSQLSLFNLNGMINGILLLPDKSRAYESGGREALVRCFATWRELDRFMTVGVRGKKESLRNSPPFSFIENSDYRLFDAVYLVDQVEKQSTPDKTQKYIADFLMAAQDEAASSYLHELLVNSSTVLSITPETAFYSSFGVFTIKSNLNYEKELAAHRISQQVIKILLDPVPIDESYRSYRHANRELPDSDIPLDVRRFLSSDYLTYGEEQVVNSHFLRLIARFEQELDDPRFIESLNALTREGWLSDSDHNLLFEFTDIFRQVQNEIVFQKFQDFPSQVRNAVSDSKDVGNTPAQRYDKQVRDADTFERQFFGLAPLESRRLGGEFYYLLIKASEHQIEYFKNGISHLFARTLNGQSPDAVISKAGKLFYALQFIDGLVDVITKFSRILEQALLKMDVDGVEVRALQRVKDAQEKYLHDRYNRVFYAFWNGFTAPSAEKAEKEYISSLKYYWSLRMKRILLEVVHQTTREMKDYLNRSQAEFSLWLDIFKQMSGMVDNHLRYLERSDSLEKEDGNRVRVLSKPLPELGEYINRVMGQFEWSVDANAEQLSLECRLKSFFAGVDIKPKPLSKDIPSAIRSNYDRLISGSRNFVEEIFIDRSAARDIETSFDPGNLAETLLRNTEPFYRLTPVSRGPLARYNIICIGEDRSPNSMDYFHQLKSRITSWSPRASDVILVNIENPYALIFLTLDNLIAGSDFDTFQVCLRAYTEEILRYDHKYRPKAHLYQAFSAEINALEIETRLPSVLQKPFRPFSPQVVALLEDKRAIRLFFDAILFGILRVRQGRQIDYTEDGEVVRSLIEEHSIFQESGDLDLFEIISRFTGKDYRFINFARLEDQISEKSKRYRDGDLRTDDLENLRAFLGLIITKATEEAASAKWADLLDLTAIFLRQSSEDLGWHELSQLTTVASSAGIHGLERLRERTQVANYFERAGYKIQKEGLGEKWFISIALSEYWKAKIGDRVLVYLNKGKALDHGDIREIYDLSTSLKLKDTTIFVIVDQTPTDSAWLEIATLRTAAIRIIPVDDSVIKMGQEAQNERIELDKALSRFIEEDLDLFSVRHPIADRLNFFGREAFASKIIKSMEQGKPVGLFGLRKIGKSSLLYFIRNQALFPVAYVDLQKGWEPLDLYDRILTSLRQSLRVKHPNLDWDALPIQNYGDPGSEFISRINDLCRVLSRRNISPRLGLIIDEIELLMPGEQDESRERYLYISRTLRGLVQEDGNLSIVIAGVSSRIVSLNRLGDDQNPFYQFFDITYLEPLSQEDTAQMIRNIGQQMGLRFSDEAAKFAAAISGGHPFLARQLCSLAIRSSPEIRTNRGIELDHLKQAARDFIQNPDYAANLDNQGLWGEVTNAMIWPLDEIHDHEFILENLAESQPSPNKHFLQTTSDLSTRERALHNLTSRSVITNLNQMVSLRFDLFRNWIRKYRLKIFEDV